MSTGEPKASPEREWEPGPIVDALARDVIGAAIVVHRILGPGLLESIYEEALCIELASAGVSFERQLPLEVHYRGREIGTVRLDLLIDRRLVVELKAVESIAAVHIAQVLSYLRFTRLRLGILVNFNVSELRQGIKRVIRAPRNGPQPP